MSTNPGQTKVVAVKSGGASDQIWRRDNAFRQITAMFVDVVDSSSLMQQLGLDDYSDFLSDFQSLVAREAVAAGGYVAEYLGDGVVLYFGYPKVSDEDQINAMSCALSIVAAAKAEELPFEGLRIGIATGQSILDRDESNANTRRAVGDCLTKASRIQAIADVNAIAVCATTPSLTRDLFTFASLGQQHLKGFPQAEEIFQLTGHRSERQVEEPYAAARLSIGRQRELDQVATEYSDAQGGQGRLVVVQGEAGIGKSHFSRSLATRLLADTAEPTVLYCTPITAKSSFLPLADFLNLLALRLLPETFPTRRARLENLLKHRFQFPPGLDEVLLASLLPSAVETAQGGARLNLSGARAAALDILADQVLAILAAECQNLVFLEDLHWADSGTLEFLKVLFEKRAAAPVLIAATTRPEGPIFAGGITGDHLVSLSPLSQSESRDIIAALNPDLDASQLEKACASAGGLPLLLEEYAQALAVDPEAKGAGLGSEVSATVNALVQTKLDRLGIHAQRLVEVGAVIGQRFRMSLASNIAGLGEAQFEGVLAHLRELDLIRTFSGSGNDPVIDFKHALISDAIYGSIPRRRRALIHNAIAEGFEQAEETVSNAVIASHFERADKPLKAAKYYLAAAQEMSNLGDPGQTLLQVNHAIECATKLEGTAEGVAIEIEARALEGLSRMVMQGPGSPDFGGSALRARELSLETGAAPSGQVLFGAGLHSWASAKYGQANAMIAELRESFPPEDPGPAFAANLLDGVVSWHRGQTHTALDAFSTVIADFQPQRDDPLYAEYLMDFKTFSGFYSGLCYASLGRHQEAAQTTDRALQSASPLMRPHPIGFAMLARAVTAMFAGNVPRTVEAAEQCVQHSTSFGFPEFIALANACLGWAALRQGKADKGLELIHAGQTGWAATGFRSWEGLFTALHIAGLGATGQEDAARAAILPAQQLIEDRQEHQFLALIDGLDAALNGREDHFTPDLKQVAPAFLL